MGGVLYPQGCTLTQAGLEQRLQFPHWPAEGASQMMKEGSGPTTSFWGAHAPPCQHCHTVPGKILSPAHPGETGLLPHLYQFLTDCCGLLQEVAQMLGANRWIAMQSSPPGSSHPSSRYQGRAGGPGALKRVMATGPHSRTDVLELVSLRPTVVSQ